MNKANDWYGVYYSDLYVHMYASPQKVIRETKHYIVVEDGSDGTRWKKHSNSDKWFPTFKEAQAFAADTLNEKIKYLEQQKRSVLTKKP